jgi:hypothetical protein
MLHHPCTELVDNCMHQHDRQPSLWVCGPLPAVDAAQGESGFGNLRRAP